jgi:hypothetical protein
MLRMIEQVSKMFGSTFPLYGTSNLPLNLNIGDGMNNADHISESLETIFWVKVLKFFDADPGSGMREGKDWDPG